MSSDEEDTRGSVPYENRKVLKITPKGRTELVTTQVYRNRKSEMRSLDALLYKDYKLILVMDEIFLREVNNLNVVATTINEYIWKPYVVVGDAEKIYGTVYILEDNIDMTMEIWQEIQNEIKAKKERIAPLECGTHIKILKKMLLDKQIPYFFRENIKEDLFNANNYGRVVYRN